MIMLNNMLSISNLSNKLKIRTLEILKLHETTNVPVMTKVHDGIEASIQESVKDSNKHFIVISIIS